MNTPDEMAALYLAGALGDVERDAFEARLNAGWPEGEEAMRQLSEAVRELAAEAPPVDPPLGVREALLAAVDDTRAADRTAAARLADIVFRFVEDGEFVRGSAPGVWVRMLHLDRQRRQFSGLVRLEPGASYPAHAHDGPEECLVLEGDLTVGGVRMRAGDYQRVEPGTDHGEQRSEGGALLYITAPLSLISH
ncbi:MAG TPA: cupin domain-containing protein [Fimbriiglobus sp.]|nr:cupin domain-containing protein [Fimbriiglobus sp.]